MVSLERLALSRLSALAFEARVSAFHHRDVSWCGYRDFHSDAFRPKFLKLRCLVIPTYPHINWYRWWKSNPQNQDFLRISALPNCVHLYMLIFGQERLELSLTPSKGLVLPLHYWPINGAR